MRLFYQALRQTCLVLVGLVLISSYAQAFSKCDIGDIQCVPYAYGDFNADKFVDIFCVSQSSK